MSPWRVGSLRFDGAVMSRAEEYRRYAAECIRVAQVAADPKDKALLLEMAEKWRELAKRADHRES
jgi:hypothetical protein